MGVVVAIAISIDVTCAEYVSKKLDQILKNVDDYEIVSVNDKHLIIERYALERGRRVTAKTVSGRVSARQALANTAYAVAFWSGSDLHEFIFVATQKKLPLKISPIQITSVVNKDSGQSFDIYIGRGSPLGNPFPIEHGTDKDRAYVIEKYREYFYEKIVSNPEMTKYLDSLHGLKLGCHCKPAPCHGDIIAEYLNSSQSLRED